MLHILRWTLAVCLQGAGCRSRCRGRALYSAFGSVSHKYILDILSHIKAPLQLQQYIKNLYSSLSAYIYTKEWSTPTFPIKRGVFQGDTLSPLLFLIAFNPILQALCIHPTKGFSLLIEKEAQYSAFGSVSHKYILDILSHIKAPLQLQQYIKNLYSSLSAYIYTKEWSTPTFPIKRGVFQGDTLSPLLFLIAFNPILQALCIHPTKGFSLLIEKEAQVPPTAIPKTGSYVYALWNEYPSDEKPGLYLAKSALFQMREKQCSNTELEDVLRK